MVTTKKPEITDYTMKHATRFRLESDDNLHGTYPFETFIKKDKGYARRKTSEIFTPSEVRNFLIYTMNDCDSKKLNYTLRVYRQDSKHRYTYGWFEIIGRNGKREKVNII